MVEGHTEPSSIAEGTTESLSQFGARVLNQLSISAWLPAAALVLCVAFTLDLGAALDEPDPTVKSADGKAVVAVRQNVADRLTAALHALSGIGLGGALLLLGAITVLTMLTQAFSFEAIRVLEGYWGTGRVSEELAGRRAAKYSECRSTLDTYKADLRMLAWQAARIRIENVQSEHIQRNETSEVRSWTPDMLTVLGANLTNQKTDIQMSRESRLASLAIPWLNFAPPDLQRRIVNADKAIRDFPHPARTLPTKLGNVLRAYEDQTGREHVETMVQDVYDQMPPGAQGRHNESRNRLDLYCSMVFVLVLLALVGWLRLGWTHWVWAAVLSAGWLALAWLMYRAAIASARAYGLILLGIARTYPSS